MKEFLTYEEFGAVGDGVTDDIEAIIACHEKANESGTPVKAKDGAKYYIGKSATATVKTDVDFGTAEFIIDDVNVARGEHNRAVFSVSSDFGKYEIKIDALTKDTKKLDFSHEGNAYVRAYNDNHKVFIRKGLNQNAGSPMQDCFIVDKDGNIKTDIDWNFSEITRAYAKCIDDKPITLKGGTFITVANRQEEYFEYYTRNITVKRSNVTIEGLTHLIIGEGEHGAPYAGFINLDECTNATVKDCVLTPHLTYFAHKLNGVHVPKGMGKPVPKGTYDFNFGASIGITAINVTQTVDIHDTRYWGTVTSNFSKDVYFEGCKLSRFDAHQGVTNVTLKNCEFGHQRVNLIGHGKAYLENCTVTGTVLVMLRADYGATWDGDLTVKNCTLIGKTTGDKCLLFSASNSGDHDFGYVCSAPRSITVDEFTYDDSLEGKPFAMLPCYDANFDKHEHPFPYVPTRTLSVKNFKSVSGKTYTLTTLPEAYEDLIMEEN